MSRFALILPDVAPGSVTTIGVNCEIILDGTGYFVHPGSYRMHQPRVRRAVIRADNAESYIDLGPGKRIWSMTIICKNDLVGYDGSSTGLTGQQYRDALRNSYLNSVGTTITFTDPLNSSAIPVHFDDYQEMIIDLHSQVISQAVGNGAAASYMVTISLVEA